jgi:hypothetical protein
MAKSRSRGRGTRSGLRKGRAKVARSHSARTVGLSARTGGVGTFARRGGGGGGYRGFKSKKQWRWAHANKKPWASKKSRETAGGPVTRYRRLPASKHSGRKGARTR